MKQFAEKFKAAFVCIWNYKVRIIIICVVLCILLGAVNFINSSSTASANISLNYSEASLGLNPNSTRFNIHEIVSKDVMKSAIKSAGLQDKISVSDLSNAIKVEPVDTKSADDTDSYISTTYRIVFDGSDLDIGNTDNLEMLKIICSSYREYFIENYGDNQEILKFETNEFSDDEPYIKLDALSLRLNQLERYLENRIQENKSYTDEKSGENFLDLQKSTQNLIKYDIPNISAYILETSVTKDKDALLNMLNYKNRIEKISLDTSKAYYESDNKTISLYDKAMSAIVMIPSKDKDNEYYMSKTKTALDELARSADSNLEEANTSNEKMTKTDYVSEQMKKSKNSVKDLEKANQLIGKLENNIKTLSDKIINLDNSYVKYKTQNYLVFKYDVLSFSQKIHFKRIILGVIIYGVLCFAVCFVKSMKKKGVDD